MSQDVRGVVARSNGTPVTLMRTGLPMTEVFGRGDELASSWYGE
jgi:hypothetical protein